jgi:hypothetical protein
MTDAPTTAHPGTSALPTPAVTVRRGTPADADDVSAMVVRPPAAYAGPVADS